MKSKLNHSKMSAEELAKTQVLNLNDVEQLATYEKSISKKPAIILGAIGLFAVSVGLIYPKINTLLGQEEKNNTVYNRVEDKEQTNTNQQNSTSSEPLLQSKLTCMKTSLASTDGTDTTLTYNFNFANDALQSYTKLAIINPSANNINGIATVENLYNGFTTLSQTPITGYYLQASKTSTGLSVSFNVDLTRFNYLNFPSTHKANYISNVDFSLNATKEVVINTTTNNGFTCQ